MDIKGAPPAPRLREAQETSEGDLTLPAAWGDMTGWLSLSKFGVGPPMSGKSQCKMKMGVLAWKAGTEALLT